jgi:transcriptional regulator GlxA family with amidase domain
MSRRIAFLIYPDFQLLDAAGPIAAFEVAEHYAPGSYQLRVVAAHQGAVVSSSGASLNAGPFGRASDVDTLIISGGVGTRAAAECARTRRFVRACGQRARRIASVCSGTDVLAAVGLLDGKRATTHWSRSADFARRYPKVRMEADRIFIRQGQVWTAAGITSGIDLSLALIEEDLGEAVARKTAQLLVVYYRRPGGQSQFSALLDLERPAGRFVELLDHIRGNLRRRHTTVELAEFVSMSPRHFFRAFLAETGMTPAKAVERLRTEAARNALAGGTRSIQDVARSSGFVSPDRMRRAFIRMFGAAPSVVRARGR